MKCSHIIIIPNGYIDENFMALVNFLLDFTCVQEPKSTFIPFTLSTVCDTIYSTELQFCLVVTFSPWLYKQLFWRQFCTNRDYAHIHSWGPHELIGEISAISWYASARTCIGAFHWYPQPVIPITSAPSNKSCPFMCRENVPVSSGKAGVDWRIGRPCDSHNMATFRLFLQQVY